MTKDRISRIPKLIKEIYRIIDQLELMFPGRKFTPDGHLVGSIGEVLAASAYDLELLPASTSVHDARSTDSTFHRDSDLCHCERSTDSPLNRVIFHQASRCCAPNLRFATGFAWIGSRSTEVFRSGPKG